jgi:Flp pilus assembly protein TadG
MVETLLILPVFLTIVFTIMEMGYVSFWVIALNHATFECARIGAMTASGPSGDLTNPTGTMQAILTEKIHGATLSSQQVDVGQDQQAGITNYDLEVTSTYDVPLVFPLSGLILSNVRGRNVRQIQAVVDMPIERPLPYSQN